MIDNADIKIIPYVEVNGMRTLTDDDIMDLYDRVVSENLYPIVFYEGTVASKESFLKIMKGNANNLYVLKLGNETTGFVWLNRFEGRTAHFHFCTFKNTWGTGKNTDIAKQTLSTLINMQGTYGYCFDLFIGWLPVWNHHAIDFVKNCGAKSAGIIPNAIYNMESAESESAEFIYLTREDLL